MTRRGRRRRRSPLPFVATLALLVACERADAPRDDAPRDDTTRDDVRMDDARDDSALVGPPIAPLPGGAARFSTRDSLRFVLERLVAGAPARGAAAPTWFSERTANVLRSIAVDDEGHAVVDFADLRAVIPNASSSAGSAALLDDLNAAVFSVSGVASVEYRMEGSCALFGEWLQYGICMTFSREEQDG